jgi:hypothetical protein
VSREDEGLLFQFLTAKRQPEPVNLRKLTSFIITTPKSASKVMAETCLHLEKNQSSREEVANAIATYIQAIIKLLESDGKFWYQNVREIKTILLGIPGRYLPLLLRSALDDLKDGELIKSIGEELSDGEIVQIIVESLRQNESPDDVRALSLFLAHSIEKRKMIYPLLVKKIESERLPSDCLKSVTEDLLWSEISFSSKTNLLLKNNLNEATNADDVRSVLKELLVQKELDKVEVIVGKILTQLAAASGSVRGRALGMLSEVLDTFQDYHLPVEMTEKIVRVVNERLEDDDGKVRNQALEIVSNHGNALSLPHLLHLTQKKSGFTTQEDDEVRKKAILALGNLGDKRAIDELRKLLLAQSFMTVLEPTDVRLCAIQALAKIGGEDSKKILKVVAEKDGRQAVREEARRGLAKVDEDVW